MIHFGEEGYEEAKAKAEEISSCVSWTDDDFEHFLRTSSKGFGSACEFTSAKYIKKMADDFGVIIHPKDVLISQFSHEDMIKTFPDTEDHFNATGQTVHFLAIVHTVKNVAQFLAHGAEIYEWTEKK